MKLLGCGIILHRVPLGLCRICFKSLCVINGFSFLMNTAIGCIYAFRDSAVKAQPEEIGNGS